MQLSNLYARSRLPSQRHDTWLWRCVRVITLPRCPAKELLRAGVFGDSVTSVTEVQKTNMPRGCACEYPFCCLGSSVFPWWFIILVESLLKTSCQCFLQVFENILLTNTVFCSLFFLDRSLCYWVPPPSAGVEERDGMVSFPAKQSSIQADIKADMVLRCWPRK